MSDINILQDLVKKNPEKIKSWCNRTRPRAVTRRLLGSLLGDPATLKTKKAPTCTDLTKLAILHHHSSSMSVAIDAELQRIFMRSDFQDLPSEVKARLTEAFERLGRSLDTLSRDPDARKHIQERLGAFYRCASTTSFSTEHCCTLMDKVFPSCKEHVDDIKKAIKNSGEVKITNNSLKRKLFMLFLGILGAAAAGAHYYGSGRSDISGDAIINKHIENNNDILHVTGGGYSPPPSSSLSSPSSSSPPPPPPPPPSSSPSLSTITEQLRTWGATWNFLTSGTPPSPPPPNPDAFIEKLKREAAFNATVLTSQLEQQKNLMKDLKNEFDSKIRKLNEALKHSRAEILRRDMTEVDKNNTILQLENALDQINTKLHQNENTARILRSRLNNANELVETLNATAAAQYRQLELQAKNEYDQLKLELTEQQEQHKKINDELNDKIRELKENRKFKTELLAEIDKLKEELLRNEENTNKLAKTLNATAAAQYRQLELQAKNEYDQLKLELTEQQKQHKKINDELNDKIRELKENKDFNTELSAEIAELKEKLVRNEENEKISEQEGSRILSELTHSKHLLQGEHDEALSKLKAFEQTFRDQVAKWISELSLERKFAKRLNAEVVKHRDELESQNKRHRDELESQNKRHRDELERLKQMRQTEVDKIIKDVIHENNLSYEYNLQNTKTIAAKDLMDKAERLNEAAKLDASKAHDAVMAYEKANNALFSAQDAIGTYSKDRSIAVSQLMSSGLGSSLDLTTKYGLPVVDSSKQQLSWNQKPDIKALKSLEQQHKEIQSKLDEVNKRHSEVLNQRNKVNALEARVVHLQDEVERTAAEYKDPTRGRGWYFMRNWNPVKRLETEDEHEEDYKAALKAYKMFQSASRDLNLARNQLDESIGKYYTSRSNLNVDHGVVAPNELPIELHPIFRSRRVITPTRNITSELGQLRDARRLAPSGMPFPGNDDIQTLLPISNVNPNDIGGGLAAKKWEKDLTLAISRVVTRTKDVLGNAKRKLNKNIIPRVFPENLEALEKLERRIEKQIKTLQSIQEDLRTFPREREVAIDATNKVQAALVKSQMPMDDTLTEELTKLEDNTQPRDLDAMQKALSQAVSRLHKALEKFSADYVPQSMLEIADMYPDRNSEEFMQRSLEADEIFRRKMGQVTSSQMKDGIVPIIERAAAATEKDYDKVNALSRMIDAREEYLKNNPQIPPDVVQRQIQALRKISSKMSKDSEHLSLLRRKTRPDVNNPPATAQTARRLLERLVCDEGRSPCSEKELIYKTAKFIKNAPLGIAQIAEDAALILAPKLKGASADVLNKALVEFNIRWLSTNIWSLLGGTPDTEPSHTDILSKAIDALESKTIDDTKREDLEHFTKMLLLAIGAQNSDTEFINKELTRYEQSIAPRFGGYSVDSLYVLMSLLSTPVLWQKFTAMLPALITTAPPELKSLLLKATLQKSRGVFISSLLKSPNLIAPLSALISSFSLLHKL